MCQFKKDFAPWKGDLLYGKSKTREKYIKKYMTAEQGEFVDGEDGAQGTMDDYNDDLGTDDEKNFKSNDPKALEEAMKRGAKDSQLIGIDAMRQRALKSRFSPTGVFDPKRTPDARLKGEFKEVKVIGTGAKPVPDDVWLAQSRKQLAIRRMCKFGIAFVAKNEDFLDQGAMLRFALDGLDLEAVVSKAPRTSGSQVKWSGAPDMVVPTYVPVTTSELRYICRHWDELKARVQFYVEGERVSAPWMADYTIPDCFGGSVTSAKASWEKYLEKREGKKNRHLSALD